MFHNFLINELVPCFERFCIKIGIKILSNLTWEIIYDNLTNIGKLSLFNYRFSVKIIAFQKTVLLSGWVRGGGGGGGYETFHLL